jgi:glutathione S-transferase
LAGHWPVIHTNQNREELYMKLYNAAVSGNCHKVRMLLSMLDLPYEVLNVDLAAGENRQPQFLAINPLGRLPVLDDDGLLVRDSQAILIYLARKTGAEDWYPSDAAGQAEVAQWLMYAVHEVWVGPALARAALRFGRDVDLPRAQASAGDTLAFLERHLQDNEWLALGRPTIGDIACYPYCALAGEGEIDLAPYAALQAWFNRIQALPNYVSMPGLGG